MKLLPQACRIDVAGSEPLLDAEALCWEAARTTIDRFRLNESDQEDLIAYLLEQTCRLAKVYDPTKDRALEKGLKRTFANYAFHRLHYHAVIEWDRQRRPGSRAGYWQQALSLSDEETERVAEQVSLKFQGDFSEIMETINVDFLSPKARRDLLKFARPIYQEDKSIAELAEQFNISKRLLSRKLDNLRVELEQKVMLAA